MKNAPDKKQNKENSSNLSSRAEEFRFVDGLVKDIYFEFGIKIPRAKLLVEIVDALKRKGTTDKRAIREEIAQMFIEESGQ